MIRRNLNTRRKGLKRGGGRYKKSRRYRSAYRKKRSCGSCGKYRRTLRGGRKNRKRRATKKVVMQRGGALSNLFPSPLRNFGRSIGNDLSNFYNGYKGVPAIPSPYPTDQPFIDKDIKYIGAIPQDLSKIMANSKNQIPSLK